MRPFKLEVKRLHYLGGKLSYESKWNNTAFRFDSEKAAQKEKRIKNKEMDKKCIYRVTKND